MQRVVELESGRQPLFTPSGVMRTVFALNGFKPLQGEALSQCTCANERCIHAWDLSVSLTLSPHARIMTFQGETAFLLREEAMIDGTRDALQSFRTALQKRDSASQLPSPQLSTSGHNDVPPPTTNAAVSLGEPPAVEESEPKVEGQAEPAMPGEVPPPPPGNNVLLPKEVQDPFAKVDGEEDVERGAGGVFPTGPPRPESPKLMMQQPSEEKANAFDAFPPVADAFASDPFAVNGFDETQLAEVAIEDPFSATDAVFTNATTAASDGFDAFPSSSGASFDAFGQ